MPVVLDADGKVIQRSKNLRGIRRYVANHPVKMVAIYHPVKVVAIYEVGNGEGKLHILFEDGSSYETNFASYHVLTETLRNWRNLYGAPLRVNGRDFGVVEHSPGYVWW